MPSKKKKFNARFPPARIKKIMQTDDDVGKVAAPVPVIISRALELFLESLIVKTKEVTHARNARTLTCSHIKQTILSEKNFDFLKDLVANVPDVQPEEEEGHSHPVRESTPRAPGGTGRPRGRPRKIRTDDDPAKPGPGRPRKRKTPPLSDGSCDNEAHSHTDDEETDEASEDNEHLSADEHPSPDASSWPLPTPEDLTEQVQEGVMPSFSMRPGQISQPQNISLPENNSDLSLSLPISPEQNSKILDMTNLVNKIEPSPETTPVAKEIGPTSPVMPVAETVPAVPKQPSPPIKRESQTQPTFPHHIENLIKPDAPRRDNFPMFNHAQGKVEMKLPTDHENNITGKCPAFIGFQPVDLTVGHPMFPMAHLPPSMVLPGGPAPCISLPPQVQPVTQHLPMPSLPSHTISNPSSQEDDDYDS